MGEKALLHIDALPVFPKIVVGFLGESRRFSKTFGADFLKFDA